MLEQNLTPKHPEKPSEIYRYIYIHIYIYNSIFELRFPGVLRAKSAGGRDPRCGGQAKPSRSI